MNPIDCARRGDATFFKNIEVDVLNTTTDEDGNSLLSIAAKENQLECCKEIGRRCPPLLYQQSNNGNTALHYAASKKRPDIVKYLITVEEEIKRGGQIIPDKNLLTMVNTEGKTALYLAVHANSLEIVKLLLETNFGKDLLTMSNEKGNTALHKAVYDHRFEIAEYLIEYDVNHEYCVNSSGDTPLMLAINIAGFNPKTNNSRSARIRKLLLEKQPSKAIVGVGNNGWTALHHASYRGDLSAIEDIMQLCPDSVEMIDKDHRNFLHIAAKNEHLKVVKHVLGTKQIDASVLNGQDIYGNTPLHIAALNGNESMTHCLLYDPRVNKNTKNNKGQDVLDAINFDYDKAKAGVFGTRGMSQNELKEQSDFDLVVGALIGAVSFTTGITLPGGYNSDGPHKGMAVMSNKASFIVFVISNNFALMFSLYAVFSHFCTRRLREKEQIISQLNVATLCTLSAIFAMMIAFIAGTYTVLASSVVLAAGACSQCCLFFGFALFSMWRMCPLRAKSWLRILHVLPTRRNAAQTLSVSTSV